MASALAIGFLGAGCSSVRTVDVEADDPAARAQIERRLQEVHTAAQAKDFARLESYHLYGPKFTRFSDVSALRQDAAATRQIERDGLASLQGLKLRAEALKIDVFGHVGIATFTTVASFDSHGAIERRKHRSTLVFVQENGEWKIIHEHFSPISQAETGGPKVGGPRQSSVRPPAASTSLLHGSVPVTRESLSAAVNTVEHGADAR